MRPQPVVEDQPNVGVAPRRVIAVGQPATRSVPADEQGAAREPWTPREEGPAPPPPPEPPSPTARRPVAFVRAYRSRILAAAILCTSLLVAVVAWRSWPDPAQGSVAAEAGRLEEATEGPSASEGDEASAGTAPVTTEIRVLQPSYTVQRGDTLGSIARKHETTIEALASMNRLENRNALSVGQRLIIP